MKEERERISDQDRGHPCLQGRHLCVRETMFLPPGKQEARLGKQRAGWVLVPLPACSWMSLCRLILIISLAVAGND